ncbi:MAG: hypothetical protein HY757_02540 [Nitrospirae bacterium]|nr:hypothetical protein [Nitrospirota bacterium]
MEGFFCLPGGAGKPSPARRDVAPIRGKTIRIARALPATAGSEGSDRKRAAHSASEPDTVAREGKRAKRRDAQYLIKPVT